MPDGVTFYKLVNDKSVLCVLTHICVLDACHLCVCVFVRHLVDTD